MAERPNILLIVADDMGYGDFGLFSEGRAETPALDALAGQGVCLTQHYSGSAVCAPARAALLTGRYPHRTGAIDTLEGRGLDRLGLSEVTLADLLRRAGYATGLVGKWHNGALDPRFHPNARGFDEFAGFRGGWQDYYRWRLDRNGTLFPTDGRYLTDVFTEEALEFIDRHRRRPFFLHLAYNAPHFPFQCPAEDVVPFAERGEFSMAVSIIYGMNRRMDRGIGRILERLEAHGLDEDTIVLFTSDNGPQFGGEGPWCTTRHNCGYRGAKCLVWEGGIRVPAILRWPAGGLSGGGAFDGFVHFTDWLPTLLAAADLEPPADVALDGVDVLPALVGERDSTDPRRFWQWNRYTPVAASNAAMRDGPWKLVRPAIGETMRLTSEEVALDRRLKYEPDTVEEICRDPEPERTVPAPPEPELFNLDDDPLESNNLAASEPERLRRMLADLEAWFASVEADRRAARID